LSFVLGFDTLLPATILVLSSKRKNHLCAGKLRLNKEPQAEDAVATGPVHENGLLNASMVSVRRFHGGGGRPVFGLWASYSVAASHLDEDSALVCALQLFVPITAAGQRWIFTSFPFNKPQSGLDLHLLSLHGGTRPSPNAIVFPILRHARDIHNL
jgi:hypothetical protein